MSDKQNLISREDIIAQIPQQDMNGNGIFRTYEFTLTGTNHKHGGNYGDTVALKAHSGDPVTLIFDKNNAYDDRAIRVEWNGKYIGWIPRSAATWKDPIITRLEKGCTVNAFITLVRPLRVKEKIKDEKNHDVWEDVLITTVDIIVVLYDLPNQRVTSDKNKHKDFREPIPESAENSDATSYLVGLIIIGIIILISFLAGDKIFDALLSLIGL